LTSYTLEEARHQGGSALKVYVASSFKLIDRVKEVVDRLEAEGHKITVKWWDRVYEIPGEGPVITTELKKRFNNISPEEFYSKAETKRSFDSDCQGIEEADALVFVADDELRSYNGASFEAGYATALGKPCLLIGVTENSAMFYRLIRCSGIEEVCRLLRTPVEGRGEHR
jgi:hypothetical protein